MSNSEPSTGPEQKASADLAAELVDASQRPSIWELALPSILGNLSYTIVGMVQTKFVGELGPQALAAVGAGQRVMFAMLAILMAVSAGTTALVARAWGAGDYEEASRVTMASLVLAGSMAAVVAVVMMVTLFIVAFGGISVKLPSECQTFPNAYVSFSVLRISRISGCVSSPFMYG